MIHKLRDEAVIKRQTIDEKTCLRLKQARKKRGYRSGRAFALQQRMPVNTYLNHENGKRAISIERLRCYAAAFNVPLTWLISGEGPSELKDTPTSSAELLSNVVDQKVRRPPEQQYFEYH